MSNPVPSASKRRKTAWLGAAALAALIAGGAVESGLVPPAVPAYAQAPIAVPATQPMPSFADVVEKVKPAVVSVRVKANMVADRSDDGDEAFGCPMSRRARRWSASSTASRTGRAAEASSSAKARAATARRKAQASSSRLTATS